MGCLVTILGAVALFFLGMGINALNGSHSGSPPISFYLVFFGVPALIFYFIHSVYKKSGKNKDDFYVFCGGKDKLKYEDYSGGLSGVCAIALDVNAKTLFLKKGNIQKAYPFTAIRDWESGIEHGTRGTNTVLTNEVRTQTAYLTIHVKDVDHPVWKMTGIPNQRWFEILNQEVNES